VLRISIHSLARKAPLVSYHVLIDGHVKNATTYLIIMVEGVYQTPYRWASTSALLFVAQTRHDSFLVGGIRRIEMERTEALLLIYPFMFVAHLYIIITTLSYYLLKNSCRVRIKLDQPPENVMSLHRKMWVFQNTINNVQEKKPNEHDFIEI